jgi:hypothetical protein
MEQTLAHRSPGLLLHRAKQIDVDYPAPFW